MTFTPLDPLGLEPGQRVQEILKFLNLWYYNAPLDSFFSLARTKVMQKGYPWHENFFLVDEITALPEINDFARRALTRGEDLYFSALTFKDKVRSNDTTIPRIKRLFADLDDASSIPADWIKANGVPKPDFLWATSFGMYQAGWDLSEGLSREEFAGYNKALTYKLNADRGGWHASKLLRVPWSYNAKRQCWVESTGFPMSRGKDPKKFPAPEIGRFQETTISWEPPTREDWADLVRRVVLNEEVPEAIIGQLFTPTNDRSLKLWMLAKQMKDARVDKHLALTLLWGTSFNKWRSKPQTFVTQLLKAFDE